MPAWACAAAGAAVCSRWYDHRRGPRQPTTYIQCLPVRRVRTVVFDKTGTLTAGKPAVVDFRTWQPEVGTSEHSW